VLVLASAAAAALPVLSAFPDPGPDRGPDRVVRSTTCYVLVVMAPGREDDVTFCPPLPMPPPFGTAGDLSRG